MQQKHDTACVLVMQSVFSTQNKLSNLVLEATLTSCQYPYKKPGEIKCSRNMTLPV